MALYIPKGLARPGDNAPASASTSGWTASSITPPELPIPPGFLTPEQVVEQSKSYSPKVKTFSAADFLTQPANLVDPKLATRAFSSVPTTTPVSAPLSVSAYQGVNMPSFLTNAVNQLNQSQSSSASMQAEYRQKLLDAVLSGNYLAAEALRAASVTPGTDVTFAAAVQNPQFGQSSIINAASQAKATEAATQIATKPYNQQTTLQNKLRQVETKLAGVPAGTAFGGERTKLTQQQIQIQQELEKLAAALPKVNIGLTGGSAYVR